MDVLVVEDDQSNRDMMLRRLARHDIAAASATTFQQALDAIAKDRPALVLLDIGLPDEDGIVLIRRLKRDPATSRIHIIVTTSDGLLRAECDEAGADAFLVKPIDFTILFAMMERFGVRAPPATTPR